MLAFGQLSSRSYFVRPFRSRIRRDAGIPNRVTRELKEAILKTAEMIGSDEKGKDSIQPKEEEAFWT